MIGAALTLLGPALVERPLLRRAVAAPPRSTVRPVGAASDSIIDIDVQIIQRQFESVRTLPRVVTSFKDVIQDAESWSMYSMLEVDDYREPTYRRLFTHKTWQRYTGGTTVSRLARLVKNWPFCAVLTRIWPFIAIVTAWSVAVSTMLPKAFLSRLVTPLSSTLSLQGTAIAFLLVFRTDNAYRRLEEARECWAQIVHLCREIVTKSVVSMDYAVVCDIARYLCAFSWSLRDKLRTTKRRDDILELLLPESECKWISTQRSRPSALLQRVRKVLYRELNEGNLPTTTHYMLDVDVRDLNRIVMQCERLFSSPIPPNMARHGMRSLLLWLFFIPLVLAGTMPWYFVAGLSACTAYIYVGIDELGVLVEQPFKYLPLWQLCHLVQFTIEEAIASPELPLRVKRERETDRPDAERFDAEIDAQAEAEGEPLMPS